MSVIELSNVGPVSKLTIPIPEDGGVCVLRARNGRGKTKTLEAIESVVSGRGKVEVRDGQLRGEIDAFGVSMKVGRSTRRTGELEVSSLEGRLSVAELVDPNLKSPEAADARRIKALVQLSGVNPSAELFYRLVGGRERFESLVSTATIESDDLVVMAERIKRDLESAARKEESQADHADGRAKGAAESLTGIDLKAPSDTAALQAELEDAIRQESALQAQAEAESRVAHAVGKTRAQLAEAEKSYTGPTLVDTIEHERSAATAAIEADEDVTRLREQLAAAERQAEKAHASLTAARKARVQAERHESLVAEWRQQLATTIPRGPVEADLVAARAKIVAAREAVERGAVIRRAQQKADEAQRFLDEATAHRKASEALREAAKGTDEVLSEVVGKLGGRLRVEAGRLVLDTARGATYFAELSHGERWKLALDIAIDAVGPRGVLTVPQEAWESCDDFAREAIVEHVRGTGVVLLTAECSRDEEVVAEVLQ